MLSKARLKYFNSLKNKKFRDADNLFVAEGERLVGDLITHFSPRFLLALRSWMERHGHILPPSGCEIMEVTEDEMARITLLNTPSPVYALFNRLPEVDALTLTDSSDDLLLALDTVQDPGNLGTIIRTADWFGVRHILCSHETADLYNPKVIQSTMGAISRVSLSYCDLAETLALFRSKGWNIHGTFLDGRNLYNEKIEKKRSVIVMGNEGNGISPKVSDIINSRLLIPSYPPGESTSESLNVSVATAVMLAEFRRR